MSDPGSDSPYAPLAEAHRARAEARGDDGGAFAWVERLVSEYDLDGPRVRMGIAWFVLAVGGAVLGVVAVAVVFGVVAAVAGLQTSGAWRRVGWRPNQAVAGLGALAMAFAATLGIGLAGLVSIGVVAAAVLAAYLSPPRRLPPLLAAGATVRSGFFVGLAAVGAVLIARTDAAALITLIVLVSGYEIGDYLVGTGAASPVEGPVAGIAAVLVLTFAVAVFEVPPFESGAAWVFGLLVAALAPLGRFVAPILLPKRGAKAPALKRLDSYLVVAPVWAWMLWSYLL